MPSFQPQLWTDRAAAAVAFYEEAFGATVLHRVGEGDDIVVQRAVEDAAFRVSAASEAMRRLTPGAAGGTTGRVLLVTDDPDGMQQRAVAAGATAAAAVGDEHGWAPRPHRRSLRARVGDRDAGRAMAAATVSYRDRTRTGLRNRWAGPRRRRLIWGSGCRVEPGWV